MIQTETKKYITKTGTIYLQNKKFEDGILIEESWSRSYKDQSQKLEAAGYIAPSDQKELAELYKNKVVIPNLDADSTIGLGESKNRKNLINLINDFRCSGESELGGKIVFLESSGSTELRISSEIVKIE